jgi:hypothetical protein
MDISHDHTDFLAQILFLGSEDSFSLFYFKEYVFVIYLYFKNKTPPNVNYQLKKKRNISEQQN